MTLSHCPPRVMVRRPRMRTVTVLLLSLLLFSLCGFAQYPTKTHGLPLSAEIKYVAPFLRRGAPIPLEVVTDTDRIREVSFVFVVRYESEIVLDYRPDVRMVGPGKQTFHMLLPPLQMSYSAQSVSMELELMGVVDGKTLKLRTLPFMYPQSDRFGQHLAVCTLRDPPSMLDREIAMGTTIGTDGNAGLGDPKGIIMSSAPITTWMNPEDMPQSPIAWCAYDTICLFPGTLAKLRETQLHAIAEWVRGGGSIVVMLDENPVKLTHIAFLNLLAETGADRPWFAQTDGGGVCAVSDLPVHDSGYVRGQDSHVLFRTGIGRSVVLSPALPSDYFGRPAWYEAKAFLWRVPASFHPGVMAKGVYCPPDGTGSVTPLNAAYNSVVMTEWQRLLDSPDSAVTEWLLTNVTTTVPGGLLMIILVAFVISVGPLQFRVLKRFNLTRWTWILFPLTAAVFTVLTIMLANAWIGRETRQRSLHVVDLDRRKQPVRSNRFDLFFSGRSANMVSEARNAMLSAFTQPDYLYGYGVEDSRRKGPRITGTFPGNYRLEQTVAQWAPNIVRQLSFGDPGRLPPIPEKVFDLRTVPRNNLQGVPGHASWKYGIFTGEQEDRYQRGTRRGARSLSMAIPAGFHLLSIPQSPRGGNFDDLALKDITNAKDSILLVIYETESDIYLFRRPCHE